MPGVTEQEIAQAKQMNLYQYMQLCEPDNFKPEGPGQFRHKGHSSLTFAEDGSWTYFKTKATGRTALNYLIAVEGTELWEPLAGCCLSSAVLLLCWRCWMAAMGKQQLLPPLHF